MLQRQRRVREAQAAAPDALPAARPHAQSIVDRPQAEGSRQAGGGVARHRPQDDIASLKMTSLARLISHVSVSIAFYSWHMNRRKVVCTDLRFQSWVSFWLTVFRACSCARRPPRHSAAVSEFTGKCDFFRFCKELAVALLHPKYNNYLRSTVCDVIISSIWEMGDRFFACARI